MSTALRKQRLRTLENEIREDLEAFYHVGMKLKEIRDDRLYKEDGFDNFAQYVAARFEMQERYARHVITASEYRQKIPSPKTGANGSGREWTERSVRELSRIETLYKSEYGYDEDEARKQALKDAPKVAKSVLAEVSKGEAKLTAKTVRQHVNAFMEVDDKPASKPSTSTAAEVDEREEFNARQFVLRVVSELRIVRQSLIEEMPGEVLTRWASENPSVVARVTEELRAIADLVKGKI